MALRRRVRSHLIRQWVLLQEDLDAGTALRNGLVESITTTGEEHHFLCSLAQRLASESTVDSQMILPGVLATDTPAHGTQQVRYPLAGVGQLLLDEGSWRQTAEYILQSDGIHAMVLQTSSRTQRGHLGPHAEANSPKRAASDQHAR